MQDETRDRKRLALIDRNHLCTSRGELADEPPRGRTEHPPLLSDRHGHQCDQRIPPVRLDQGQSASRLQHADGLLDQCSTIGHVVHDVSNQNRIEGVGAEWQRGAIREGGTRVGTLPSKSDFVQGEIHGKVLRIGQSAHQMQQVGTFSAADLENPLSGPQLHRTEKRCLRIGDVGMFRLPMEMCVIDVAPVCGLQRDHLLDVGRFHRLTQYATPSTTHRERSECPSDQLVQQPRADVLVPICSIPRRHDLGQVKPNDTAAAANHRCQ